MPLEGGGATRPKRLSTLRGLFAVALAARFFGVRVLQVKCVEHTHLVEHRLERLVLVLLEERVPRLLEGDAELVLGEENRVPPALPP